MLDALSPQRRRLVLVAGAAAVVAIVALAAVVLVPLLRPAATTAAPVRQDQPRPSGWAGSPRMSATRPAPLRWTWWGTQPAESSPGSGSAITTDVRC